MNKKYILLIVLLLSCIFAKAQAEVSDTDNKKEQENKKSTELGIGLDMQFLSRVGFQNYSSSTEGDHYKLKLRDVMFGGNLYVARELNPWFYLDLQGTLGAVKAFDQSDVGKGKTKMFGMVGPGVQFRLTPLFKRKYVEPYFRVGINYYYKGFDVIRKSEMENMDGDIFEWMHSDQFNDKTDTRRSFFPFAFGFGVNSWFNDRVGFGIQGEYLTTFNSNRLSFPHVTARVMVRFGSSKKSTTAADIPEIRYVDRIVTKEVPVEVIKEVIVDRGIAADCDPLFLLFSNINFDFDKSTITTESNETLDNAAVILKKMGDQKFLITGFTDSKGSNQYNKTLSENRAQAVKNALLSRGVSKDMLKGRGVGKNAASMPANETSRAREGDRKVTIELINNMEYWNRLP